MKCRLCGKEDDTVRIVVRDEYDAVRFAYRDAEDAQARQGAEFVAIDRGADLYRSVECKACRVRIQEER